MKSTRYFCYLLASKHNGTLYTGVTSNLLCRVYQHKMGLGEGFTQKYNVNQLVWFEEFSEIQQAIQREKQIKKWNRNWKRHLIEEKNPDWDDLYHALATGAVDSRLHGNDNPTEVVISNKHWQPSENQSSRE
jgi:putative endonuclease